MATEAALGVQDVVVAELVECEPPLAPPVTVQVPPAPDTSPAQRAAEATIEQTGADPPPAVT